jgi:hypothetical protein
VQITRGPIGAASGQKPGGGVDGQWFATIFPRIRKLLPAPRILEIAPGHGRWTAACVGAKRYRLHPPFKSGLASDELNRTRLLERGVRRIPFAVRMLRRGRFVDWDHARAKSMTAKRFADASQRAGLACVRQEITSWGEGRKMIDCFSSLARPGSRWDRPNAVVINPDFMSEALSASRIAGMYSSFCEQKTCSERCQQDNGTRLEIDAAGGRLNGGRSTLIAGQAGQKNAPKGKSATIAVPTAS